LQERDLVRSHEFGKWGEWCLREVEDPWANLQDQYIYWRGWVSV
jgi:hypothetical protein